MGKNDPYVVCKNPSCRPHGQWGPLSFRRIARGPVACKFCYTDFELPPAGNTGWWTKDGKGRARPEPVGKDKDKEKDKASIQDVDLCTILKGKCGDDPHKLGMVEQTMAALCPPKVLSEDEKLREAFRAVERTNADVHRLTVQCGEMEASCARRAREFMEYQNKLAEAQNRLEVAKDAVKDAKQYLLELQAADVKPSQAQPATGSAVTVSSAQLAAGLGKLDFIANMDAAQSKAIFDALSMLVNQVVTANASPPLPPPNAAPAAAVVPIVGAAGEMVGMDVFSGGVAAEEADADEALPYLDNDLAMEHRDQQWKRDNQAEAQEGEKQSRRRIGTKTATQDTAQLSNSQVINLAKSGASKLLASPSHLVASSAQSSDGGTQ